MGKVNVGEAMVLPWYNMYQLYTTKPINFNGNGGYNIIDGRTHFMIGGTINNDLVLPTPSEAFTLYYFLDGEPQLQENFSGTFTGRGNIYMEGSYINE